MTMAPLSWCIAAMTIAAPQSAPAVRISDDVQAHQITDGVWRFVTWLDLPSYGRTPANALLLVSGREALLINTGWTNDQAARISAWAKATLGAHITLVVPTHAHADTIGGLAALHQRGVESWAQEGTAAIARARGQEVPHHVFGGAKELRVGERVVQLAFLGAGHTSDNIVAWLPAERILFAGCLVKAAGSRDLGNLEDANVGAWPTTVEALISAYPSPRLVIPGHGDPGSASLLTHTLLLARTAQPPPK